MPLAGSTGLLLVTLAVGGWYYQHALKYESTDDAFVAAHVVMVSPKVASYVATVAVGDNHRVRVGDLLVTLDARDFEARLAQAQANLRAARARYQAARVHVEVIGTTTAAGVQQAAAGVEAAHREVEGARSRLAQAQAQVAAAAAEATRAETEAARYDRLLAVHAVSQQEREAALASHRSTAAQLEAAQRAEQAAGDRLRQAQAQLGQAEAQLAGTQAAPVEVAYSRAQAEQAAAEIAQGEAAVRQAALDLSYTRIVAPEAGHITKKVVEPGDFVQPGRTLLAIVPEQVWIVANFKETQLEHMHAGQPVVITVDAYPGERFRGHVESIQSGAGAAFSLLPPENATGNYVKVVQRVPVKIVVDDAPDPTHPLGPGMSVVPTVRVR